MSVPPPEPGSDKVAGAGRQRVPGILAVTQDEPFDPGTWSGSSSRLLAALSRRGALLGAVSARFGAVHYLERAAAFSPNGELWRQRAHTSSSVLAPLARSAMSRRAARRAAHVHPTPDALMQIGAWFDLSADSRLRPRLRCSYQDANMGVYLRRPDLALDLTSKHLGRALDYERRLYDRLDLILTMSEWLRRSFVHDFGQDPDKVVAVGAGANIDGIPPAPERDFSTPRLLFVGKLFRLKGGPLLLAAFRLVRSERPDAELWIVGPTTNPTNEPGVRFFGRIPKSTPAGAAELDRLFREATAYVMPSVYDAFPIVFLEAMAYRLPCVAAASAAMREQVEDGVTGFVAPHDPEQIAERLLTLIDDPVRARAMGEAGYQRFVERYTWDEVAGRIVAAITARLD